MSSSRTVLIPFTLLVTPFMVAQTTSSPQLESRPIPPPVVQALPGPAQPALQPAAQRVYTPANETLISRQAADGVLEGFRKAYVKDGAPRIVVYVNRALVDTQAGVKLTSLTENYEKTDSSTKTSGSRSYSVNPTGAQPTLADQQTVREVERLVGRVFRTAGAQLADQKTAATLLPEQAGAQLVGDQAAKDREALAKIADVAIEVLISSRAITLPGVSGDQTYSVPDIQATAIRLKDSAIIGQAAASDIIGKGLQADRVVRRFDVADITEATAIALIEDMLTGTAK